MIVCLYILLLVCMSPSLLCCLFQYNGLHRVSLLFRIAQGKQFYIDLVGRTLPPSSALAGSQVLAALDHTASSQTQGLAASPQQRPSTKGSQTSSRGGTRDGGGAMTAASNVPNFLLRLPLGIDNVYSLNPLPIGNNNYYIFCLLHSCTLN